MGFRPIFMICVVFAYLVPVFVSLEVTIGSTEASPKPVPEQPATVGSPASSPSKENAQKPSAAKQHVPPKASQEKSTTVDKPAIPSKKKDGKQAPKYYKRASPKPAQSKEATVDEPTVSEAKKKTPKSVITKEATVAPSSEKKTVKPADVKRHPSPKSGLTKQATVDGPAAPRKEEQTQKAPGVKPPSALKSGLEQKATVNAPSTPSAEKKGQTTPDVKPHSAPKSGLKRKVTVDGPSTPSAEKKDQTTPDVKPHSAPKSGLKKKATVPSADATKDSVFQPKNVTADIPAYPDTESSTSTNTTITQLEDWAIQEKAAVADGPSDPYISALMHAKLKTVLIVIRRWHRPHKVTAVLNGKPVEVPMFGKCIKGEPCYSVPDPQRESWLPNFKKRFVFVLPSDAEEVYVNGIRISIKPGVFVFQKDQVTPVEAYASRGSSTAQSVTVLLSAPAKPIKPIILKSVTSLAANSGYSAIEMTPVGSESGKHLFGAEFMITPAAKLARVYIDAETQLFNHQGMIKPSATSFTVHIPGGFMQYATGEAERPRIIDFSEEDDDEFFLCWVDYPKTVEEDKPVGVYYQDGEIGKINYFDVVPDTTPSINGTNPVRWRTELVFEERPTVPFKATVIDADAMFNVTIPAKSAVYEIDPVTKQIDLIASLNGPAVK